MRTALVRFTVFVFLCGVELSFEDDCAEDMVLDATLVSLLQVAQDLPQAVLSNGSTGVLDGTSTAATGTHQLNEIGGYGPTLEKLSVFGAAVMGVVAHLIQNRNRFMEEKKQFQIHRLSRQIEEFYGPLRAQLISSKVAFNAMLETYAKTKNIPNDERTPLKFIEDIRMLEANGKMVCPETLYLWTQFITKVAVIHYARIAEVLSSKAHLYDHEWPEVFFDFFAHEASVKMMTLLWENDDFSQLRFVVEFPDSMHAIVNDGLAEIRCELASLLGLDSVENELTVGIPKSKSRYLRNSGDSTFTSSTQELSC